MEVHLGTWLCILEINDVHRFSRQLYFAPWILHWTWRIFVRLVKTNLKRFKSKDEPSVHLLVSFTWWHANHQSGCKGGRNGSLWRKHGPLGGRREVWRERKDKWQEKIARGNTARMTGAPRERKSPMMCCLAGGLFYSIFLWFFLRKHLTAERWGNCPQCSPVKRQKVSK